MQLTTRATMAAFLCLAPLSAAAGQAGGEVLNNESIVQMVTGKVPKDLITTKIRTTRSAYDITPSGLIGLVASKVSNDLIKMMMTAAATSSGAVKETLTNDAVIRMVTGQLSKDIIIMKIQMSKPDYDLTTSGIISLNTNKVSQDVVKAMMASASSAPPGKP